MPGLMDVLPKRKGKIKIAQLKGHKKPSEEPKGKYTRPIEVPGSPAARAIGGMGLGKRKNGKPSYYMIRDVVEYKLEPVAKYLKSKDAMGVMNESMFQTTLALDILVNGKETR